MATPHRNFYRTMRVRLTCDAGKIDARIQA